ncbi:MAG TPA: phage tail protein [Afipia sp.]|nr:phage tail protein [Afipia sp.]OUX62366.1 MAG: phage tail protein [Afipia sp. TMED4]HAO43996.1 phage tail protein [Afipia sp.]HAQ95451.1 phage tail protein [Afipia sp.]HBF53292.1 phage tail protein [Afipia sp.]
MTFWKWSRTASSNATADSTCPFPEGMNPGALNDGNRGMMAAASKYRDDISGLTATGGTSTAYTLSSYQAFDTLAHMNGALLAFTPHVTNGQTVTLNVDGLGAKPLRPSPGVELQPGVLVQGTPYAATYNNSDAAWYLRGYYLNPFSVPLGGGLDYWGASVPNTSFAFPIGQAISRTTYSALFALIGTTHGTGDGSTTFNLPDKTGRVSAMKEASATRLTSSYFGGNSSNLGAVGGSESHTLTSSQIPAHTHPNSLNESAHSHSLQSGLYVFNGGGVGLTGGAQPGGTSASLSTGSATTGITITNAANTGGGGAHNNVQPTIICNYIMRII